MYEYCVTRHPRQLPAALSTGTCAVYARIPHSGRAPHDGATQQSSDDDGLMLQRTTPRSALLTHQGREGCNPKARAVTGN